MPRKHTLQDLAVVDVTSALLKIQTVIAVTGISRSAIYRLIKDEKFPAQVKIGKSARWNSGAVREWLNSVNGGDQ